MMSSDISRFACGLLLVSGMCLSSVLVSGCGTILDVADTGGTVYGGVKRNLHDAEALRTDRPCMEQGWLLPNLNADPCIAPLYPIDLLMCVAADTLLLPYTGSRNLLTQHRRQATEEQKRAKQALIQEYVHCLHTLEAIEAGKALYAASHNLAPSDAVPQDVAVYRGQTESASNPPYLYRCPAGGEYRVGKRGEDPSCSVHGTLTAVRHWILRDHGKMDLRPKKSTE
jgi:uncharacterized protein YceK